ncbi:MAG: DUF4382 domain-containing protein [Gemmatimonadetes bacterium]|nr:DUF4382 domain-containing protein [Gemmatimonadota bacterium]
MRKRHLFDPRLTLAFALALAGAACAGSDSMLAPNHGRVHFVLGSGDGAVAVGGPAAGESLDGSGTTTGVTDPLHGDGDGPPRPMIKTANVTFSSVLARNVDGVLVNVDTDLPVKVDVLRLEGGRQIQLPDGDLLAGTYDQVVVVMTEVQIVLGNDTPLTINPPGGGWTAIVPLCPPVEVEDSGTSTVSLTLEVRNSFLWGGDGFHFEPRFRLPLACRPVPPPPPPAP